MLCASILNFILLTDFLHFTINRSKTNPSTSLFTYHMYILTCPYLLIVVLQLSLIWDSGIYSSYLLLWFTLGFWIAGIYLPCNKPQTRSQLLKFKPQNITTLPYPWKFQLGRDDFTFLLHQKTLFHWSSLQM